VSGQPGEFSTQSGKVDRRPDSRGAAALVQIEAPRR
jgi:hypothetical protein